MVGGPEVGVPEVGVPEVGVPEVGRPIGGFDTTTARNHEDKIDFEGGTVEMGDRRGGMNEVGGSGTGGFSGPELGGHGIDGELSCDEFDGARRTCELGIEEFGGKSLLGINADSSGGSELGMGHVRLRIRSSQVHETVVGAELSKRLDGSRSCGTGVGMEDFGGHIDNSNRVDSDAYSDDGDLDLMMGGREVGSLCRKVGRPSTSSRVPARARGKTLAGIRRAFTRESGTGYKNAFDDVGVDIGAECGDFDSLANDYDFADILEFSEDSDSGSGGSPMDVVPAEDTGPRSAVLGLSAASIGASLSAGPADHGPSLCTSDTIAEMMRWCKMPEGLVFRSPKPHERPWTPPAGFIALYEHYFTDCGLWFPLPEFLTRYCARRKIAISQLSVGGIRNAAGLAILGTDCGVEVDVHFLEEATRFTKVRGSPGYFYTSAKSGYQIVTGAEKKICHWQRYFFFVKLDETSVDNLDMFYATEWNMVPEPVVRLRAHPPGFFDNLRKIRARGAIDWPSITQRSRLPRLGMGKVNTRLPRYADQFKKAVDAGSSSRAADTEVVDPSAGGGVDLRVAGDLRSAEVAATRADKRAAKVPAVVPRAQKSRGEASDALAIVVADSGRPTPSRKRASHGEVVAPEPESSKRSRRDGIPRDTTEIDDSFSFSYKTKDELFINNATACGELASKVRGSFDPLPSVGSLYDPELYRSWARKHFQDGGGVNRMVVSYERRIAELEKQLADSRTSEPSRRSAEELRQDLDKERGVSAVLTKQTAGFRKQVADLKASLNASRSRLEQFEVDHAFQKAQLQQLQAERHGIDVEVADYKSRIERMRRHIIDNRAAQESLLTLSQVSGTYDCLQELVKSGTVIPSKTLLGLEADVKMWEEKVLGFDIADVLDSDLEALPETAIVPTNLQAAEVPVVVGEEVVMAGAPAGSGAQVAAEQ
ncbi:PREDICTED: uncharacterized protein At3g60930, chloroplastic-like [Camelina sativa]|uniref:Uncharacterized protein At3g60930, chloroplastic-like n=1 Tax=Camelina sativa TaxID=90675 RepID=A0ABM0US30_CAMSA|nr:PREDICTED: uncharacterized protein At3g60930, chloroplastic-like [Camelina sativa]XP_010445320.1 PREDICTED: uncharacterized protein At3g60930, chloroplastic-like [Camelina sativa]